MEDLFNNVYKGKKVLITGHTGFKGSWLALWLTKLGAEVIGYSKGIPTDPNHISLLKLPIISIDGDILDKEKLFSVVDKYQPDIIFHMAAQALVRKSYENPLETKEVNVMGTLNVLEAARRNGKVRVIINITSDKSYHNTGQKHGYVETDRMGGDDPYSASKGAAEIVSQSYRKSFFHPKDYGTKHNTLLANVRAGNVIGGGDWADDRLIPDMVRAASQGKAVETRNPHATRPWQHVLEALSGYLHLAAQLLQGKKEFAEDWNFGPNDDAAITVKEVLNHSMKHWDKIHYVIIENPNNPHEAAVLSLDSTKARTKLKWKSIWNSEKTFEKTVGWYKHFYTHQNHISEQDLLDYIGDAKSQGVDWATS